MKVASLFIVFVLYGVQVDGGDVSAPRTVTHFSHLTCGYCCNPNSFKRPLSSEELIVFKLRCSGMDQPGKGRACMHCCIPNFERGEKPVYDLDWIRKEKAALAQLPCASHVCEKDTCATVGTWHPEQSGTLELIFEGLIWTDKDAGNSKLQKWARTEFGESAISKRYVHTDSHVSLLVSLNTIPKKRRDAIEKICADKCAGSKAKGSWVLQPAGGNLCGRASISCRRHVGSYVRMLSCHPGRAVYQCSGNLSKMDVAFITHAQSPSPSPSTSPVIRWMLTLVFDGMDPNSPHANTGLVIAFIQQRTQWPPLPGQFFNWRFANGDGILHFSPPRMPESLGAVLARALNDQMFLGLYEVKAFVEPYDPLWLPPPGMQGAIGG